MLLPNNFELVRLRPYWHAVRLMCQTVPEECPENGLCVLYRGEYAASVVIYPTNGPFAVFEHLVTARYQPLWARHSAVQYVVVNGLAYCTAVGKQAVMFNRLKGVRMMLSRMGVGGGTDLELLVSHLDAV